MLQFPITIIIMIKPLVQNHDRVKKNHGILCADITYVLV